MAALAWFKMTAGLGSAADFLPLPPAVFDIFAALIFLIAAVAQIFPLAATIYFLRSKTVRDTMGR